MPVDYIREQLEKQDALIQTIAKDVHIIKRRLLYAAIMSYIKIALILIPLIITIVYLLPLLKNAFAQYSSIMDLNSTGGSQGSTSASTIQKALNSMSPDQLQTILKSLPK